MKETNFVAQVILADTTYYMTDRNPIQLDGNLYENSIISIGDVKNYGNIGTDAAQIPNCNIVINNGGELAHSTYRYPINKVWNNQKIIVKLDSLEKSCLKIGGLNYRKAYRKSCRHCWGGKWYRRGYG